MPQPMKGPRFGGNAAHSRIILRNLTSQLFEHGRVVTTLAKAKQVRPIAEKLITRAKVDTVANRRIVNRTITDKGVSHVLFTEIAPMMAERNGGYTRITRIGDRKGDAAPMAVIELVTDKLAAKDTADDVKAKIEQEADESASAESAEDAPAVPVAADEAESEADAPAEETSADKA